MPGSDLATQTARYLDELRRAGASAHSVKAYESDLRQFLEYLSPPDLAPPPPEAIDVLILREWLASLYRDDLAAVSIRRKLAAVRGLFRFLLREGLVTTNVARLVRGTASGGEGRFFGGDFYQLTINSTGHGNSGGPMFDHQGRVIGVYTLGWGDSAGAQVSGSIPIRYGMELMGVQPAK